MESEGNYCCLNLRLVALSHHVRKSLVAFCKLVEDALLEIGHFRLLTLQHLKIENVLLTEEAMVCLVHCFWSIIVV